MTTKPKSRWRRWTLRLLIVLTAGVLLTIASSWVLQWRAFRASASNERWVMSLTGRFGFSNKSYQDLGNGHFRAQAPDAPAPPTPIDRHIDYVPDVSWFIIERDGKSWIRRNEWDHSMNLQHLSEPSGIIVLPGSHSSPHTTHHNHVGPASPWHELDRAITPKRALPFETSHFDWHWPDVYITVGPGWVGASSFRASRDELLHALHRPVERWSAQRCGWPMHAMMTEQYAIGPRPPIERVQDMPLISLRHGLRGGLILHHQPQHPMLHPMGHHSLPLTPLWPGFALNTALYAACIATLWLTTAGSIHLLGTKKRRRKQGLCESCGYDIQNLKTCPECGNPRSTNQCS